MISFSLQEFYFNFLKKEKAPSSSDLRWLFKIQERQELDRCVKRRNTGAVLSEDIQQGKKIVKALILLSVK